MFMISIRPARVVFACFLAIIVAGPANAVIRPGITVGISDLVQLPNSQYALREDNRVDDGFTRINFMKELPDNSDRWMINDRRGEVYVVDSFIAAR